MTLEKYLRKTYPELTLTEADTIFAREVGTTRQSIGRYRTFKRWPNPEMVAKIRRAVGAVAGRWHSAG
jgi:hypothetical protein